MQQIYEGAVRLHCYGDSYLIVAFSLRALLLVRNVLFWNCNSSCLSSLHLTIRWKYAFWHLLKIKVIYLMDVILMRNWCQRYDQRMQMKSALGSHVNWKFSKKPFISRTICVRSSIVSSEPLIVFGLSKKTQPHTRRQICTQRRAMLVTKISSIPLARNCTKFMYGFLVCFVLVKK